MESWWHKLSDDAIYTKSNSNFILVTTECERDLGVMVSSDLKWTSQVKSVCAKAKIYDKNLQTKDKYNNKNNI
ncbi:hypothetical protein BpHYR1_034178 [Brachionus plicatilis]|uniref:Uncharacterized protein n=1 Tax=Brachionus plicatilis TaxID=10195 RepID=A0A3M7QL61_BRAPC|nr:hypothetical protein BpHYR1_034178 [Brachionus plicatilis]